MSFTGATLRCKTVPVQHQSVYLHSFWGINGKGNLTHLPTTRDLDNDNPLARDCVMHDNGTVPLGNRLGPFHNLSDPALASMYALMFQLELLF